MKHLSLLLFTLMALTCLTPSATAADGADPTDQLTLVDIEREQAVVELNKERNSLMLARVMPFLGMGFTVVLIMIVFRFIRRADQIRHETIRQHLEKGQPVPR